MTNKEIVLGAYRAVFRDRDAAAIDRFYDPKYIQHNPMTPDGLDALRELVGKIPPGFRWEPGLVLEDGDMVMIQSRFTGMGPKPAIRVDIVRLENGRIAEHWDLQQEESEKTVSGHPMFEPTEPVRA